jgi:hypothetical protein
VRVRLACQAVVRGGGRRRVRHSSGFAERRRIPACLAIVPARTRWGRRRAARTILGAAPVRFYHTTARRKNDQPRMRRLGTRRFVSRTVANIDDGVNREINGFPEKCRVSCEVPEEAWPASGSGNLPGARFTEKKTGRIRRTRRPWYSDSRSGGMAVKVEPRKLD